MIIVILGLLAAALPMISTTALGTLSDMLIIISGDGLRIAHLLQAIHAPGYWWLLDAAVLATIPGLALIAFPFEAS